MKYIDLYDEKYDSFPNRDERNERPDGRKFSKNYIQNLSNILA